ATMGEQIQQVQNELLAKNGGTIQRGFHAKAHACVKGTFEVLPELPQTVARGLFAQPKTYDAWIRLSNGISFVQRDSHHDERGLAIKVLGVKGPKLAPGADDAESQDFNMTNNPTTIADDARGFMDFGLAIGS